MKKFIILIPLFNDWKSASKLIKEIDLEVNNWEALVSILLVNDASTESRSGIETRYKNIKSVKILNMKKNTVHQRCIAAGLKYIFKNENFDRVIVMDADGEDRPQELSDFYRKTKENPNRVVTGNRYKRSEGLAFRILYQFHKILTLIFTGQSIKFGNFTCLSKITVEKMLNEKATWNSFSASLKKTEKNLISIPSIRGTRYFGPSKMSFFNLLKHSLSIISVFRKTVLIRSALFIIFYILLIKNNASIITSIPLVLLLIMIYSISSLALRENIDELDKSLENIIEIEKVK